MTSNGSRGFPASERDLDSAIARAYDCIKKCGQ
jgi:hypothetical protein